MKKTEDSDVFSDVKHRHDDPATSLDYAHDYKSIIYVSYNAINGKAPINRLYHSKTPETQQVDCFMHARKTSDSLFVINRDVAFAPGKLLLVQAPLQKFPFK